MKRGVGWQEVSLFSNAFHSKWNSGGWKLGYTGWAIDFHYSIFFIKSESFTKQRKSRYHLVSSEFQCLCKLNIFNQTFVYFSFSLFFTFLVICKLSLWACLSMHTIKLSWEGFLFALFNSIFVRLFERQLNRYLEIAIKICTVICSPIPL